MKFERILAPGPESCQGEEQAKNNPGEIIPGQARLAKNGGKRKQ